MKRYTAYSTYILIFMSMNSISTLEARGFFDALADFFYTLNQDNPPQQNAKYTLSRKQAENYIDMYIASLNNELRPNASDYDIQKIREKTYNAFNQSSTIYIWVSGIRMYNKDMIDQFLLSAIVEVVESNTYNYAYSQTNNSTTAAKITQIIRIQLMKLIERKHTLDAYDLRPFFGYSLNQTIIREITNLSPQSYYPSGSSYYQSNYGATGRTGNSGSTGHTGRTGSTGAPRDNASYAGQTYASRSCCVCLDDFGGATERLFLKPCGHDMCKMCALDHFFPNNLPNQTKTCPTCRSYVDLEELYNDIL